MTESLFTRFVTGMKSGDIVPYLGPGALTGAVAETDGAAIPADSDSLILAMNNGQPMAPKLMYEFPRAAMNQELKRGRTFVNKFLTTLYGETRWTRAPMHDVMARIRPGYVIDINRDTQLQDSYRDTKHTLVTGIARMGAGDYRFLLDAWDGEAYHPVTLDQVNPSLPVLFKPMGTPSPRPNFIASDADYVDYITELMGGFAIPGFLKERRIGKQYLLMGVRLTRDTERMVLSDIIFNAAKPVTGWACIDEPTAKERRFCAKLGLEVVDISIEDLIDGLDAEISGDSATGTRKAEAAGAAAQP